MQRQAERDGVSKIKDLFQRRTVTSVVIETLIESTISLQLIVDMDC